MYLSLPVFILPHPDHHSPKSSVTKTTSHPLCSTHSATLLNLPQFCSLNETLCKFQVTTVIITALPITELPPPPARPPTLPFPALCSLLLPFLLSLLAVLFSSPAFPLPPPRSGILFQHLQPQPPPPSISMTTRTNSAPTPSPARRESKGAFASILFKEVPRPATPGALRSPSGYIIQTLFRVSGVGARGPLVAF